MMFEIFSSIMCWQDFRNNKVFSAKTLGFVPTMGNLHAGHQALLQQAVAENDFTALSIFVNPEQFEDKKDFSDYPQTLSEDIELAKKCGVNFVLVPTYAEIYPDQFRFRVNESELSEKMCGKFRPGHFSGMLTIVMKLLLLVQASRAYFGEKDWQQLQLVKGLVEAFLLPTAIVAVPTVRDKNGLALSSRNTRLAAADYQLALNFPKILREKLPSAQIAQKLLELGMQVEYVEDYMGRRLGAVRVGEVRLIDNVSLT